MPKKYEDGNEIHYEPKTYFQQQYYEAIDLAINCIKDRFQQPGYNVYCQLENLLLNAVYNDKSELDLVFSTKMILSQSFCILSCAYLSLNFNVSKNPAEHQK